MPSHKMQQHDEVDISKPGKGANSVRIHCLGGQFTVVHDDPDPSIKTDLEWLANFHLTDVSGEVRYKLIVPGRKDGKKYYILKEGSTTPKLLDPGDIFDDTDPSVGIGG